MTVDVHGGRILDTAKGILIGLRRCPSETAFHELLNAAQRHRMPVFAMAWALVHLADGGEKSAHTSADAESAARYEWGELFADAGAADRLRASQRFSDFVRGRPSAAWSRQMTVLGAGLSEVRS